MKKFNWLINKRNKYLAAFTEMAKGLEKVATEIHLEREKAQTEINKAVETIKAKKDEITYLDGQMAQTTDLRSRISQFVA